MRKRSKPPQKKKTKVCWPPDLSSFHLFGRHDDDPRVLLKHHPPEVTDGVLQAALSSDVALLQLVTVALQVQLRLQTSRTRTDQVAAQTAAQTAAQFQIREEDSP